MVEKCIYTSDSSVMTLKTKELLSFKVTITHAHNEMQEDKRKRSNFYAPYTFCLKCFSSVTLF
jgi:hypothetical protein